MHAQPATFPAGSSLQPTTILLVEDDKNVRYVARTMLLQRGYTVLCAGDGDSALKIARRHRDHIDLLIADLVMPGMNGPQLAKQLRARQPNLHVLFMSGVMQEDIAPGRIPSEAGFLEKPFTPQALVAKVQEVLAGS
ncbi:MAG TPA: response regulator [Nitrospiraceae bacterium]|nr:response regulator [Nitrospiraceae bacterium]